MKTIFYAFYLTGRDEGVHPEVLDWVHLNKHKWETLTDKQKTDLRLEKNEATPNQKRERIIISPSSKMKIEDAICQSRTLAIQKERVHKTIDAMVSDRYISKDYELREYAYEKSNNTDEGVYDSSIAFLNAYIDEARKAEAIKRNGEQYRVVCLPLPKYLMTQGSTWVRPEAGKKLKNIKGNTNSILKSSSMMMKLIK
ncbi:hypothetical protein MTBPR1_220011 [Candidatus Terasakiella magnetica]|uniref:Uncharacterized protein n=1 Tax=Candidatus Terasakiella magnetica TaxID=1867952 RepID=A0A1C3RH57_9PROT|nr:hypothetical protein [Candidatus Terasakiella magnetica]SCA56578.1 hypothetical protein MTBPR1_220011 [Candidatus Terasakiella magnetica]